MEKKTLHTETVKAGNRTFYFDVKTAPNGTNYLGISSVARKGEEIERNQVVVFENEIDQFGEAFIATLLNISKDSEQKSAGFKYGNTSIYFNVKQSKKDTTYFILNTTRKKESEEESKEAIFVFENEIKPFAETLTRTLINFERTNSSRTQMMEAAKKKYANAFEPWKKKDEADLAMLYSEGKTTEELSKRFERQPGAIKARIEKLGLVAAKTAA